MQRSIQLKDLSAVAAGRTLLVNCPVGPRYLKFGIVIGDTAAGNGNAPTPASIISEIRLNYLGGIQRRVTAARLDAINKHMGSVYGAYTHTTGGANGTGRTVLPIFLHEPFRKRSLDADALAWQTGFFGKSDSLILELDIVAAITPSVSVYALVDDFAGANGPHKIMKWDTIDIPAVGATVEYGRLDKKDSYAQWSIFDTSDAKTVDRVRVVQGSRELHDLTKQENSGEQTHEDMTPAAGVYQVVWDKDDDLRNVVPASGLSLTATLSAAAAGTMSMVSQRFGLPE